MHGKKKRRLDTIASDVRIYQGFVEVSDTVHHALILSALFQLYTRNYGESHTRKNHFIPDTSAFHKRKHIARMCKCSHKTVNRVIRNFIDQGLIIVTHGGHGSERKFDFDMDKIDALILRGSEAAQHG